jgi:predicted transcriptional regulator of viral defense system
MYMMRNTDKIKILLQRDQRIFTISDLALLWEIDNRNTLRKSIQRYVDREILFRIYKGLYSTLPLGELDKYELGCAVSGAFSYVSGESVLAKEGLIMQDIKKITLFGKKKKEVEIGGNVYLCRYLNDKYLLNRVEIDDQKGYAIASIERALADLRYINPKFFIDNDISIDQEKVHKLSREIGYNDSSK